MGHVMTGEIFVGRDQEESRLRAAFDDARDWRGGLVMITGEPGIGKTRLARELEHYAVGHGARVLWGRAHETGGAPAYWPWVQALRSLIEGADRAEVRGWVGDGAREVSRILPVLATSLPALAAPEPTSSASTPPCTAYSFCSTAMRWALLRSSRFSRVVQRCRYSGEHRR